MEAASDVWWQRRGSEATLAGILPNGRQPAVDDSRDPNTVQCVQTPPCYPIDLRRRWHRWRRRDHGGGFQILSLQTRTMSPHRAGPRTRARAVFVGDAA